MSTVVTNTRVSLATPAAVAVNLAAVAGLWYAISLYFGADITSKMSSGSLNASSSDVQLAGLVFLTGLFAGATGVFAKSAMSNSAGGGLSSLFYGVFILANVGSVILGAMVILMTGIFGLMMMSPVALAPAVALIASFAWFYIPE